MEKGSKDAQKLAKAAYYSAVISLMAIYGYVAISDLTQYDRNTLSESVKKVAEKPAEIVPALRTTVAALLPTASTTRPEPEPEPDSIPEALPPPVQLAEAPQLPPVAAPGNTAIAEGYRDQLIDPSLPVDTLEMLEQKKTDIR
ncbi:MAG: hypothetical protein OEV31_00250, partial [Gammaproteobacteria bacterium]|nr:hypothetical protein [Gammaproteobacteria bacterium]